jgi:hypothetical protein
VAPIEATVAVSSSMNFTYSRACFGRLSKRGDAGGGGFPSGERAVLGTTRETVTRLLTSLRTKKVIEVKGSTVNVMRPDALEAMVTV